MPQAAHAEALFTAPCLLGPSQRLVVPCLPSQPLDAAAQLHAVLLAERCGELGICADFADSLPTAPHNRREGRGVGGLGRRDPESAKRLVPRSCLPCSPAERAWRSHRQ